MLHIQVPFDPSRFGSDLLRALPRWNLLHVCFVIAAMATLAIASLHWVFLSNAGSLWRDEVNTLNIALAPSVKDMWRMIHHDTFPLLTSLLVRGWSSLFDGPSDFTFRLFGFAMGLSILLSLWLATWLLEGSFPLLSLALFAASPMVIDGSNALRPHSPGILFLILTYGLAWRAISCPEIRWTGLAALGAVLSVQCSYGNAVPLATILAAALGVSVSRRDRARSARVVMIGAIALLSLVPYAGIMVKVSQWASVIKHEIGLVDVLWLFVRSLRTIEELPWFLDARLLTWGAVGFLLLPYVAAKRLRSRQATLHPVDYHLLAILIGLPALCYFLVHRGISGNPVYFLPFLAIAALGSQAFLRTVLPSRNGRFVEGMALIGILISAFPLAHTQLQTRKTNIDVIAALLREKAQPGDFIVVSPWFLGITFERYYRGRTPWETLPPLPDHSVHRLDLLREESAERSAVPTKRLLAKLEQTLKRGKRIWIVGDGSIQYGTESEYFWAAALDGLIQTHGRVYSESPVPGLVPVHSWERVPLHVTAEPG